MSPELPEAGVGGHSPDASGAGVTPDTPVATYLAYPILAQQLFSGLSILLIPP
jgi:hypothetical protein